MRWLLLLFLLLWAHPALAETELPFGISLLDFGGAFLGQAPDDDMVCTRGPCYSVEGAEVPKSRQFVFSIYKKPLDITHYGKVEVAAPQYYFFGGRLFQILIRVQCAPDEAEACLERIIAKLHQDYQLTMIRGSDFEALTSRLYRTEAGALVQLLLRDTSVGEPSLPTIKIFDRALMDEVRLALNPNYVPAEFR